MATETSSEESSAEKNAPDDVADENESSGFRFWLLLIPLAVLGATGGAWLSYANYGQVTQAVSIFSDQLGMKAEEDNRAEQSVKYGKFMKLKNVIANPADAGGGKYLMVNIGFESQNQAVLDEVKAKEIVVRDHVINLLSEQTSAELADITRRDSLKSKIRRTINENILRKGKIQRMYFTQYILQ